MSKKDDLRSAKNGGRGGDLRAYKGRNESHPQVGIPPCDKSIVTYCCQGRCYQALITIFVNQRLGESQNNCKMVSYLVRFLIVMTCICAKLVNAAHTNRFIQPP